ncbi:DUF3850 domain-containing protein [Marinomonas agarivorans]|nr:DUF3850 domain-containing protein [Marinomonas agarivorans]
MRFHDLKISPVYFDDIRVGLKRFEIRKNDRDFKVGDVVELKEWCLGSYTGRAFEVRITYITDYVQSQDYVVFGFEIIAIPCLRGGL